jgi:hypothetical protein
MKTTAAILSIALLAGCQTTLDPNYAVQLESYRLTITSQREVEVAKAHAEAARYAAIAEIAVKGDLVSRQTAILALAMSGKEGLASRPEAVVLPRIPENQEDRALKWAAIFAGPTIAIAQGYFGYRLGVTQSNNTANSTIASYNALGATAIAGYGANQNIATSGFTAVSDIAQSAITKPSVVPSITINGNGVIGAGTYTGDNSGALSGNDGTIRLKSPDTTSRQCTGGTTDAAGSAAANC